MSLNEVLKQIASDIANKSKDSQVDAVDEELLKTSNKESSRYGKQYDRRDRLYSDLLQNYIDSNKSKACWNAVYKLVFFLVTISAMAVIILVSLNALIYISKSGNGSISDIAVIIGSVAGIVSSIIVIPKIIAEHLFPTNEDEHMIGLVQKMQINDSNIRKTYNENGLNSTNKD